MNLLLAVLGAWIMFDGIVSMTYFAKVDGTLTNPLDQGVRVVRVLAGLAVVLLS